MGSLVGPVGIAIDATCIYWTNQDSNTIGRANLNGTGVNHSFISGASYPFGLAVDGAHIYWANFSSNTIGRANLDGTGVNQSFITGARGPTGLAVLVPEPSTGLLVLAGLLGLALQRRTRA